MGIALVVAGLGYAALDVAASHWIAGRLHRAAASSEAVTGSIEDVDACPACASYRVSGLTLRAAESDETAEGPPLLSAAEVEVGLVPSSLLSAHAFGGIRFRGAALHLSVDRVQQHEDTVLEVPWREIGAALLPLPIDRLEAHDAVLVVRHTGYPEPIVWTFRDVDVDAVQLSAAGARPARIRATGRTPGDGHFSLEVELASEEAGRFTVEGELRDVPLVALASYVDQVMGIDVEDGRLGARFEMEGTRRGWRGYADCRIDGLDVFDPSDLAAGPTRALWDAVAGAVSTAAALREGGPLRVRLALEQRFGTAKVDVWIVLARMLRQAILAPFVRPLDALRAAVVSVGGTAAGGPAGEPGD